MKALARALRIFVLALATLLVAPGARAAFTPPPLDGHVVDTAGKLSQADIRRIDAKLEDVRRTTGFEIAALLVGSLEGEEIDDVAYKVFNAWELGNKGKDNGVLLVIAPAERKVRIETGKGVGGALTDLQSNDIIRTEITPSLRQERYGEAVDRGTTAIARTLVAGSADDPALRRPREHPPEAAPSLLRTIGWGIGIVVYLVLLVVSPTFRTLVFYLLLFGRGGGGGGRGGSGFSGGGGRSGGGGSSDSY
jgi:uncharacterized protein